MLIKIFKNNSFLSIIKITIKKLIVILNRIQKYQVLKKNKFLVNFKNEGNTIIELPVLSIYEVLTNKGIYVEKNFRYMSRPNSEVLFRKIVYELYNSKYIDNNKSIIDIGSWIGDNSLVWSKYLTEEAHVFAIDPSFTNLQYGKKLSELNCSNNIKWVEAVCSDKLGQKLGFDYSLDHATFKKTTSKNYLISSTLDEIIKSSGDKKIGFIHIDVEGFEYSVIKGAINIINKNNPVISFEQHISSERVSIITNYLKSLDYNIYMVNEVLPGNDLDCRNFFAFPSKMSKPSLKEFDQSNIKNDNIFSATLGPHLLKI